MTDFYTLPDLPYAYDALEPWCSAETLELHHGKHHQAYVDGANKAAHALATCDPGDSPLYAGLQAALNFNLGGHVMHSLFWANLSPQPTTPDAALSAQISTDFGSVSAMTAQLLAACVGVQGSGWGVIFRDSVADRLYVGSIHDHQQQLVSNSTILAVIDVWEHAYYLTHRNERASWVGSVIEHLDWATISQRWSSACQIGVAA